MKMVRKYGKYLAVVLAVGMIISTIALAGGGFRMNPSRARAEAADSNDRRVASEISNITGSSIETVLRIKNEGKSWSQVLDELKSGNTGGGNDREKRNRLLLQSSVDDDYIKHLKNEGFSDDAIQRAKLLAERVAFQLQQITIEINPAQGIRNITAGTGGEKSDDLSEYREIAEKFDMKTCIYFLLRLEKEFGSMEKVFDEYLYSLQAGIDLALYLADREAYITSSVMQKELGWIPARL